MKKRIFVSLALVFAIALSAVPFAGAADFAFTDVPAAHTNRTAIEFCSKFGFIKGHNAATFDPDGTLTREQFAVIWARTEQARMHKFSDVQRIGTETDNAIILMQALGHINGVSETEFSKTTRVTREQAIAIAYRAYLKGNDGSKAEEDYSDHASISSWAKNAVGECKSKGFFNNLFTGATLQPQKAITRAEVCQLIYNIMQVKFDITISPNINTAYGTVTANKKSAAPGETVTVTVTPQTVGGTIYRLVPGSLKYNNIEITGRMFTMPISDVVITAQFEAEKELKSLAITANPTKFSYVYGAQLDLPGMVVTATYTDNTTRIVTDMATITPVGRNQPVTLAPGQVHELTIAYTEGGVTRDVKLSISVTP